LDTTVAELFVNFVAWCVELQLLLQSAYLNLWYAPLDLSIAEILIILFSILAVFLAGLAIEANYPALERPLDLVWSLCLLAMLLIPTRWLYLLVNTF